jgi:hypothetical protein
MPPHEKIVSPTGRCKARKSAHMRHIRNVNFNGVVELPLQTRTSITPSQKLYSELIGPTK